MARNLIDLGIEILVGRKIMSAGMNIEKDLVVLSTDKGSLYLTWEGDCCANCYIQHVTGAEFLVGGTVNSVEELEWQTAESSDDEVVETMGTKIRTDKGYVNIETRLEHNGYYSGSIIVTDSEPSSPYSSSRYAPGQLPAVNPLEDF